MVEITDVSTVRRALAPEVYAAVVVLVALKWRLFKAGHGYRMLCPCGAGGTGFAVPSTPAKPGNAARRILRNAEHCPDSHGLVK